MLLADQFQLEERKQQFGIVLLVFLQTFEYDICLAACSYDISYHISYEYSIRTSEYAVRITLRLSRSRASRSLGSLTVGLTYFGLV